MRSRLSIISHLFMSLPVRQIECSSISEYSERIIKSNHLDSGKICSCLCCRHSDASVPYPADKRGLEDEGGVDGRTPLRTEIGRTGGARRSILKCTIELIFYRREHAPTHLTVFTWCLCNFNVPVCQAQATSFSNICQVSEQR